MIHYTNITRYDNLPFDQYLKLKGYGHSFLKGEKNGVAREFKETDKVILGKLVDGILSDPASVDMKNALYPAAKSIAYEIRTVFGSMISKFEKQVSFSALMHYNGYIMPTTCRLDFGVPSHAVVDLKVTHSNDPHGIIKYMGYQNQLWNYTGVYEVLKQYIMMYSVPLRKTVMIDLGIRSPRNEFWESKIQRLGQTVTAKESAE